jgi:hypothetical protein
VGGEVTLRRIRSFRVPGDPVVANELAQQLSRLEENVSAMGGELTAMAMPKLALRSSEQKAQDLIIAPGQFQIYDTRPGTDIRVGLQKPVPGDRGLLVMLLDFGGGVGALSISAPDSYINDSTVKTSTDYMRLLFCDGAGYWTGP